VQHADHGADIKYCYREKFAEEIPGFDGGEQFMMRWRGNFTAEVDGRYEFMTESDDGSFLYVDRQRVVENGGCRGSSYKL
jgi:hypothetical protein